MQKNEVFLSVVIPLFNGEKYIKEAVESVLNQPLKNIEVICVDDGSDDNSLDVVNSIKDNRLSVYSQVHKGVAAARNRGIDEAKGNYISFLDHDDIYMENVLDDKLYEMIEEQGEDIISFGYCIGLTNKKILKTMERVDGVYLDPGKRLGENYRHHSSYFFKREMILSEPKTYIDSYGRHEDERFRFRCFFKSNSIRYVSRKLFMFRNNPESTTHKKVEPSEIYEGCIEGYVNLEKETDILQFKELCNDTILHLYLEFMLLDDADRIDEYSVKWNIAERYEKRGWMSEEDVSMWNMLLNDRKNFLKYKNKNKRKNSIRNTLKSIYKKVIS